MDSENTPIAVVIDDDPGWQRKFTRILEVAARFEVRVSSAFMDLEEATLFVVNDPEFVSRLRVSHPEAKIIGTGEAVKTIPPYAGKSVEEQHLAAGADHVLEKNSFMEREFFSLVRR